MIDQQSIKEFRRDGYVVTEQLFSAAEVQFYIDHYTTMREAGSYPGDKDIPYSRMIHMHRWDDTSLRFMLDQRLANWVRALTDTEPYAVQSMVYLKPPGALGQALHQDQYYLRTGPGSCIAAWVALDPSDEENGCLQVVPGSQDLPVLCTEPARHDADPHRHNCPRAGRHGDHVAHHGAGRRRVLQWLRYPWQQ